jgi:hypothetical protein
MIAHWSLGSHGGSMSFSVVFERIIESRIDSIGFQNSANGPLDRTTIATASDSPEVIFPTTLAHRAPSNDRPCSALLIVYSIPLKENWGAHTSTS